MISSLILFTLAVIGSIPSVASECPITAGDCMCGHHGDNYVPVSDTCQYGCLYKNDTENVKLTVAESRCSPNMLVEWDTDDCLDDIKKWLTCETYNDSIIFWTGVQKPDSENNLALHRKSNSNVTFRSFKPRTHKHYLCMAQCDFDDCASSPCLNGATCLDEIYDYTCTCRDGFTGRDCETDIDDCEAGPCQNNGTCIDQVNSYSCVCPCYTGSDCETERMVCDPGYYWCDSVCIGIEFQDCACDCFHCWSSGIPNVGCPIHCPWCLCSGCSCPV